MIRLWTGSPELESLQTQEIILFSKSYRPALGPDQPPIQLVLGFFPDAYKILSNILLSRLTRYAEEIIGDHQCGFRRNRSTSDHIFCIRQILEKKWE
jgi:hypothetical protein